MGLALSLVSIGLGIWQGAQQQSALNEQAGMYERDGILMEGEHRREAARIEDEGRRFAAEQKMAYIGSGVEIGGSAVVTLAQTDKWARAEADAVRDRGRSLRDYYGRSAKIARGRGRAAFVSGIVGGVAQGISMYSMTKAPGIQGDVSQTGVGTTKIKTTGKGGYGSGASAYRSLGVR